MSRTVGDRSGTSGPTYRRTGTDRGPGETGEERRRPAPEEGKRGGEPGRGEGGGSELGSVRSGGSREEGPGKSWEVTISSPLRTS